MNTTFKKTGQSGEQAASEYLSEQGFQILERNFHTRFGEIDIVARDGDCIVFVEVKSCRSLSYGDPAAWVTYRKQKRIILAASEYLQTRNCQDCDCRFDVVTVKWHKDRSSCHHIKEAFYPQDKYLCG